jgi:signal transduction histidine kinase
MIDTHKNNYQPIQIFYLAVCFIIFLVLLMIANHYPSNSLISPYIHSMVKSSLANFVWTYSMGFFLSISIICATTYLLVRNNTIILWYMAVGMFVSMGFASAILPYYIPGSNTDFIFHSLNNGANLAAVTCGVRIIQYITQRSDVAKFNKFLPLATIGFSSCSLCYFAENVQTYLLVYSIFLLSCFRLHVECLKMLYWGLKEDKIEKYFIYNFIFLSIVSLFQALPVVLGNYETIVFIRLVNSIILPIPFIIFIASVFSKSILNYQENQRKVEILLLEKQAILEVQNETLAMQVTEQTSELQALNSTKDRLFSIIGHDLRSPIASLKGILLLIDNQQLSREEFNDLLQNIHKNVDNVYTTLENLLQWSLSQMKAIKPMPKTFNLNDTIIQMVELFRETTKQKEIDLQVNISENLDVFADENHIRIVIQNLIANALKFTPKKGQISINSTIASNYIILKVIDTGIGINPEEIKAIFTNPTLKEGTLGEKATGLGLILCKELIKQNAGEIGVISLPNQGTTFEISIPKKQNIINILP